MTDHESTVPSGAKQVPILFNHGTDVKKRASIGMLWVSVALIVAKLLSFLSQIVLGSLLTVETYAVFGLAATAVALISGFQNSSVAKALMQQHGNFQELFPKYSAFAFQFGVVGMGVLIALGAFFEDNYNISGILGVLIVTSLSIPFLALNTILIASLSIEYRFRDINLTDIRRSLIYYTALVGAALLGAEEYTFALATLLGTLAAHAMYRRQSRLKPSLIAFGAHHFIRTFWTLRWVLVSGFLIALAMRSDFFVVGKLVTPQNLGFYTFGFMLVASITVPISAGINQVFLPIFARLQEDRHSLKQEVLRFTNATVTIGAFLCLIMVGVSSVLIDIVWEGKWNSSALVINLLLMAMPFRFMATIAGVGLEAMGKWHLRSSLLSVEAVVLMVLAAIGAVTGGINGAIIGVVLQRILSAFVSMAFLGRVLELRATGLVSLSMRIFTPFALCTGVLFFQSPTRHLHDTGPHSLTFALGETLMSVVVFLVVTVLLNKQFFATVVELLHIRNKRGSAKSAG